jgi:hypothetical protein
MKHEDLIVNGLFSIKLTILLVHLPRLQDYPMQLIMVKNQEEEVHKNRKMTV